MRDLSVRDLLIFILAAKNEGVVDARLLQDEVGVSPGSAYTILNRLVALGYMTMEVTSEGRVYRLTPAAYEFLRKIKQELEAKPIIAQG